MKEKRQGQIIKIIRENKVRTHEQLIGLLREAGFNVAQSTISRDIKNLGLVKAADKDGAFYAESSDSAVSDATGASFASSVLSVKCAQHTIVMRTHPGMASAVAASVDEAMQDEFLGSVAGDDTLLIIASDAKKAEALANKLRRLYGSL